MGNEFEVYAYYWEVEGHKNGYEEKYRGESWDRAVEVMKKLKKEGVGCIKMEWRPSA